MGNGRGHTTGVKFRSGWAGKTSESGAREVLSGRSPRSGAEWPADGGTHMISRFGFYTKNLSTFEPQFSFTKIHQHHHHHH